MKDSGGNNKKKALSYKTFALVLIAVLSVVFFAFGGWNRVQSAIVDLQKRFADNEEIDGKERTDNGDGTYKLSLSVTGDADTDTRTPHANILVIYDQSGSMLAHLAATNGSYGHTGDLQSSGWQQLYKTRESHGSGYGRYYTCSDPVSDSEGYTGTVYYDSNGNSTGGCTEYSGKRYSAITRAASAEKTVYDFSNALLSKNPTSGPDTDAVEMALVTFNTNSPISSNSPDPAQGWTSNKSTFTGLFNNSGTTYSRAYSGLTNWQQALTKARSVLEDADSDPTFVVFVTDGAPTVYQTSRGTSDKVDPAVAYPYAKTPAYNLNHFKTQDGQNNGSVVTTGGNTTLYGVYAFGDEADFLDDLIYYAKDGQNRPAAQGGETSATVATTNYYNAVDSAALTSSLADIFNSIVETVGLGEAFIQDGTTQKVETTSGDISTLLEVDENSFEYWMEFPITNNKITRVDPLSGDEYEISLRKDESTGKIIASSTYWGENSDIEVEGELSVGTFKYKWETANKLYNFNPPAATFDKYDEETNPDGSGQVNWPLGKVEENGTVIQQGVGTLLDGVKYTVTFDVYPSQETYDTVASIKNAENPQTAYNNLDANIKKYLKYENGTFNLETNTNATLTYTDTHDGNTTPTTKKYRNPDPVVTVASEMDVEKVWLNQLDAKAAPDNLTLNMNVVRDNVEVSGLSVEVKKSNDWKDSVAIATGLMRTKVVDGKTIVEVLDKGHDYTLTEPVINQPDFKTYQWELQMETVHPMIINGQLTTLIEVSTNEIPSGMASTDEVYKFNGHTFYRFNGKVYYDKVIPTAGQAQTNAQLNAYNIRKSNFNFTKKVEGDPVGGEAFTFTFKVDNTTNEDVWFSVCDPAKLASLGKTCEDADANTYYEREIGVQGATAEEGDTGYFFAPDNTNITLNIKDGWNVRVTNIGTGSTYNITESAPESPFTLTNIDGTVTISVPELPANAVQTSEGVYTTTAADGTVTTYKAVGDHYEYEYTPNTNVQNRTLSGQIIAPNNTYSAVFTNTYPKTHLTVNKVWNVAESATKEVEVTLYRSVNGGTKQKVTQTGLTNPVKLNASNDWKYDFKDLDVKDANDNVYDYFTEETPITGGTYQTTYSGKENIVVSATDIDASVTEVPVTVTITGAQASSSETINVTLNKENNWKATIENKDYLNADGTVKTVTVTTTETGVTLDYALTNRTNTIVNEELTTVEGQKTWEDANNQDNVRPESITVNLIADGNTNSPVDTKTVKSTDNWSWSWTNLPKYKAVTTNGVTTYVEITYTVTENSVQYYDGAITTDTDYSFTNTHTPFKSTVTITKEWHDANNQDGKRPTSINVVLKDSTGLILTDENNNNVITLTAADNWTKTIEVQRKSAGSDVTYTVEEVGVVTADYTAEISDPEYAEEETTNQDRVITLKLDNTHTPEVVALSGEKTWADANNQDSVRPASITVTLYADGVAVEGKTITVRPNAEGKWVYDFGNLPKYKEGSVGTEIKYTVRENDLSSLGYTATYYDNTNLNILNTRTPETTGITGTKTWDDANDQDGLRPTTSVTVKLYADGEDTGKTATITPDANGNWSSYSFSNLPKYKNNGTENNAVQHEIVYTVRDNVEGYVSSTDSATSLVNTHTPELITINGVKTWDDDNNRDGKRPTSITIQLLADGQAVNGKVATVTAAADGSWSWSFANLPKYKDHGTPIVYTVEETGVKTNDYEITVDGANVTNKHVPETITVSGTKTWSDTNDQDGIRPESITVKLLADGVDTGKTYTATAPDWTYSFTGLDKYKHGEVGTEIVYSVEEVPVPNYTPNPTGYNIENTHTPFKSTITITKEWSDEDNRDGKRPTSINVVLQDSTGLILTDANNNNVITLTEANNWTETVEVQRRSAGSDVTYTVKEVGVVTTDYTAVLADPDLGTTTGTDSDQTITLNIDNQHTRETVDVEGSKTWNDADNQDGKRPQSIIINLLADGQVIDSKTVTAADEWKWSWTGLDKYKENAVGQEIVYTITENAVPEYDTPEVNGYDVTNTHTPETVDIAGAKTWADDNNRDGVRPTSININLLADGTIIDTKTVTEQDNWSWSWTGKPKYSGGTEITYTITEDAVTGYNAEVLGYNVTNTHEFETVEVSGTKNWVDNNNQDGKRPGSINVNLLADGQVVDTKTVTARDNWSWSWTGLAKYKSGAVKQEVVYTITEDTVADYTTTISGYDIENKHVPGKTVVSGSKTWTDNNDQDGKRPASITINLLADGTQVQSKVVTTKDNWTWTFDNLDEYANGSKITYTITEDAVADYETPIVTGFNVENKHTIEKTSVSGTKTWADENDQDGLRTTTITVRLLANGTEVDSKIVSAATNWSYSFTGLDKYEGGEEITYTVVEDEITGYTATTTEGTEYGITNTHIPETTDVEGTKTWSDAENQDNVRPGSIDITLKADGTELDTKTVTEQDNWSWSWTGLPKYRDHGTEIIYTVEEGEVEYYTATPTSDTGFDITNTHSPFKTSLKVVKTWNDASNQDGKRPTSVKFSLMQDGVKIYENIELNESNNWTYENNELPRRAAGREIVYSVVEIDVNRDEYTPEDATVNTVQATVNSNQTTTITVTNTHTPETVAVEGTKTWTDADNQDGKRPTEITVNLLADGQVKDSKTVTESDGWSWSWTGLPKYEVGKVGQEITYSVSEEAVSGYRAVITGYDIENIHDIDTTSISGTKTWADNNDQDGIRPASVVVTLYADGEAIDTRTANVSNNWSYSFTDLPVNKAGSVKTPITYTVGEAKEDIPEGYTPSVSGNNITNTHTPETVDITGTKVWDDANNQDGKRPASITVNLLADGTQVDSTTVTGGSTAESWNYSFTGKPKYRDGGTAIVYTVTESGVNTNDYTTTISGTTITNKHTPSEVEVPVSKTWVDTDNKEGKRPTSVSVSLLADGTEVRTATLTEENNWSWNWTGLPENRNEGTKIVYTVRENNVDENYEVSYPTATTIVNTIKNLSKNIPVAKIWDDQNNRDNARPTTITYTLTGTVPGKDRPVVEKTLEITINDVDENDPNKWKSAFENVPIFDEGTWITYTVNEQAVTGYTAVSNETIDGVVTITNNHELTTIDITATKAWDDNNDNDGKRPESVQITLYADGVEQETKTATANTNWQVKFEGLVKYAEGEVGREIVYTVAEKEGNVPEGYTPSVTGNTITNTHEALTISYKVTKDWQDFENNDGVRPDHITVRLVGKVGDTVVTEKEMDVYEINEGFENEPWTYAFTDLPKYYNKQLVQYTLTEDRVDLYETKEIKVIENKEETTTIENTITNNHDKIPYNETGMITVNKYWYDENDKYKKRPGSITVNLLADDEVVASAELSEANDWTFTFENLPKYTIRDGEVGCEIVYTIQEVAVANYQTEIEGFDIYNTYNGPIPEITPPNTGVAMTKENGNILFEMILTLLATSYTVVVLRKVNE